MDATPDELRAKLMRLVVTLPDALLTDAIDMLTERVYYHAETVEETEVDTTTRRKVSMKEAAQISRAIYREVLEREEDARETEAAYLAEMCTAE